MRCRTPGMHPDLFGERLNHGKNPGQCGQFVLYDLRGDSVGTPGVADRCNLPVDDLGAPVLDVCDSDIAAAVGGIVTPHRGPALTLNGVVTTGQPTPYRDLSGAAVTCSAFDLGAYLASLAAFDPADNQDIVGVITSRVWYSPGLMALVISNAARGVVLYTSSDTAQLYVAAAGGNTTALASLPHGARNITSFTINRDGNITLYVNGALLDTKACPAGAIGNGTGLGVCAYSIGSNSGGRDLTRALLWYGVGLAEIAGDAWHRRVALSALGIRPVAGGETTFARASTRVYYPTGPTGAACIMSPGAPPAGNVEGLGSGEQIVSVSAQNHGIRSDAIAAYIASHITPGTDAGLTVSGVDDMANLGPAREWGPIVIRIQNPTGGTLYQRLNNAIGGAPAVSWVSIRARVVAGPIRMGWQTAAGAYTNVCNVATGYARSSGAGLPGAATDRQCLELPAGADVYIIAYCDGIGARVPDEVPSLAAFGASSTVLQDVYTTTETPAALLGTVEADLVPRFWGGAAPAVAEDIVRSGALNLIRTDGAGNVTSNDGTNTATAAVVEADGVAETLRHAHGDRGLYVSQAGGAENLTTYDGALSTALLLRGSPRAVRAFRVLRNPRWHNR